jgi:SAM-dependent methyltransferase
VNRCHRAIHVSAREGFADAGAYDRSRPSYPLPAVNHILDVIWKHQPLPSPVERSTTPAQSEPIGVTTILDVGAGSGKFTKVLDQQLQARTKAASSLTASLNVGRRIGQVIGVEPVPGMREQFRKQYPHLQILDGTAENLPFNCAPTKAPNAGGIVPIITTVDAIVCAQSFHWFSTPKVLAEFARVLVPGRGGNPHLIPFCFLNTYSALHDPSCLLLTRANVSCGVSCVQSSQWYGMSVICRLIG